MKKVFVLAAGFILTASLAFASVGQGDTKLKVDTQKSKVYWTGKKVTGEHTGYLNIEKGTVVLKDGAPESATIKMDMKSIESTDLQGEWKDKLDGHLKSEDFFSVEKHPVATFEAKSFKKSGAQHTVVGDLTIKGITHEVSFPVDVTVKDGKLTANGTAKLDRTKWDIRYGSGKFFDGLGDKMIYDDFEIKFELVASDAADVSSL